MITCHKQFLFARCSERGYQIAEVMPCVVGKDGDQWTIDETHWAYPTAKPAGLGDRVASALNSIGITKDRVSALIGAPCSCPERQAALNKFGAKYLGLPAGTTANTPEPPAP